MPCRDERGVSAVMVGLDIATRTGWCRWDGGRFRTGVIDCSPGGRDEPEGVRYLRLAERFPPVLEGAQAVVIERTYSKGRRTAEVLNGLTAVALVACERRGIEYAFVDATVLKAFAIGGRASKAEMVAAAERELGVNGLTDDEADAYWLVRYGRTHLVGVEA
jgi:Holliday junction resolvasome RuvABC endonuclease subunit